MTTSNDIIPDLSTGQLLCLKFYLGELMSEPAEELPFPEEEIQLDSDRIDLELERRGYEVTE